MDKVILAKNVVLDGDLGSSRPNDNQMIFGGTGTGKSMSIVLPTLCHMRENSLIGTFAKKSIVSNAVAFSEGSSTRLISGIWQIQEKEI